MIPIVNCNTKETTMYKMTSLDIEQEQARRAEYEYQQSLLPSSSEILEADEKVKILNVLMEVGLI